jgi:hypothetical protein
MKGRLLCGTLIAFPLAMMLITSAALAQGGLHLSRQVFTNSGGASAGGEYTLAGSVGQPEAGNSLSSGAYALAGGFWQGLAIEPEVIVVPMETIYLPTVIR